MQLTDEQLNDMREEDHSVPFAEIPSLIDNFLDTIDALKLERDADAVNLAINREAEIKRLRSGIEELIVDLKTKWEPQTTAMLAAQYGIVGRLESLLNPPTTGGTE
jgi:hypothetical protein